MTDDLDDALSDVLDDACRKGPDAVVEALGQIAMAALVGSLPHSSDATVEVSRQHLAQIVLMMRSRDILRGLL